MSEGRRARADESAQRVNDAAALLGSGLRTSEVIKRLAVQHGISLRQSRRYVERAQEVGTVEIPCPKMVFTVKLPETLVYCIREYAQSKKRTLSSLVEQALEEFMARTRGG